MYDGLTLSDVSSKLKAVLGEGRGEMLYVVHADKPLTSAAPTACPGHACILAAYLCVCVADQEVHSRQSTRHHVIHSIAPRTPHPNDTDPRGEFVRGVKRGVEVLS